MAGNTLIDKFNVDILISQFCEVTGADISQAQTYLEIYNYDIASSISQYIECNTSDRQRFNRQQLPETGGLGSNDNFKTILDSSEAFRNNHRILNNNIIQQSLDSENTQEQNPQKAQETNVSKITQELQAQDQLTSQSQDFQNDSKPVRIASITQQVGTSKAGRNNRRNKKPGVSQSNSGIYKDLNNSSENTSNQQHEQSIQRKQQQQNDVIQLDSDNDDDGKEGIEELVEQRKYGSWKNSLPDDDLDDYINKGSNRSKSSLSRKLARKQQRQHRKRNIKLGGDTSDIELDLSPRNYPSGQSYSSMSWQEQNSDDDIKEVVVQGSSIHNAPPNSVQDVQQAIHERSEERNDVRQLNEYFQRMVDFDYTGEGAIQRQQELDPQQLLQNQELREIRDTQEEQYYKSIEQDRQKQKQKLQLELQQQLEIEEKKKKEVKEDIKNNNLKTLKLQRLPAEPSADTLNIITIMIKLPNGQRIKRRFNSNDKVFNIFDFIDLQAFENVQPELYRLIRQFPRQQFSQDDDRTLENAGFQKQEALYIDI